MKTIFILLLESSLSMVLLYVVYWFFLRKETFFRINRFFLTGALILSVILPLCPVHYLVTSNPDTLSLRVLAVLQGGRVTSVEIRDENQLLDIILRAGTLVYFMGACLVLIRLIIQSMQLSILFFKSEATRIKNVYIIETQKYKMPFSFFNLIFYNPENHGREDLEEIIIHERVHIRERHWIDLLIAELWSVVFWFNPFVWLFERSIKQNHEYLADAGVLAQGRPIGRYQALLINQLMGSQIVAMANHLNFSLNATRFKMMTDKTKNKRRVFRLGWVIPVLTFLLVAFAEPSYTNSNSSGKGTLVKSTGSAAANIKVTGKVVKPDGTPLPGTSVILGGTTTGTLSDADGNFILKIPANQPAILYFSYVGYVTKVQEIEATNRDITLKTNKMEEAVVQIGEPGNVSPLPLPPPPPASVAKKEQKGEDLKNNWTGSGIVPLPPPPSSGNYKNQKIMEESSSGPKEVFVVVEEMPAYPGGVKALQKYVTEMKQKLAREKSLKGKAIVEFTVNEKGKAVNPVVTEQENEGAGKGAITLVSNMKQWESGKQHGKPVPVKYALELNF